jgi:hypothetical protein
VTFLSRLIEQRQVEEDQEAQATNGRPAKGKESKEEMLSRQVKLLSHHCDITVTPL